MEEEVGFLREGEGSGVKALEVMEIMAVVEALVEVSTQTGVNSLVEVGVQAAVAEMVIIKEEEEVALQVDQSKMLVLHETLLC